MNCNSYKSKGGILHNQIFAGWLLALPALILLAIFLLMPFLMALGSSFTDQRLISNPNLPTKFVGLRNYIRLAGDEVFHRGILNNFYFAVIVVPIQTAFALALALLINQKLKGINIFRTIFFSPVVITMVVVSIVWYLLYNPGQGFINQLLSVITFGKAPAINWLQNTHTAFPAIMILSIWQGVGFQMIIFLAGLQDIPGELYEAARVDGATTSQQFWNVTLSMLRNTIFFVVISTTILSFKLFQQVWVMTQGGPQYSTMTTIVYMYRQGFRQLKVGYASAVAVVFFLIVLTVSIVQRQVMKGR